MVRLRNREFANFLDEIAGAMRHDFPLPETLDRLSDRRLGRVGKAAQEVSLRLKAGNSLADALQVLSTPLLAPAIAVANFCDAPNRLKVDPSSKAEDSGTGDSSHPESSDAKTIDWQLMTQVSQLIRQRSDLIRRAWVSWCYPMMVFVLGYVVTVSLAHQMTRAENADLGIWPAWAVTLSQWLLPVAWQLPLVGFALLVMVGWWIRRSGFVFRPARMSLLCSALADQISFGVPEDVAIKSACQLAGETELADFGTIRGEQQGVSVLEPLLRDLNFFPTSKGPSSGSDPSAPQDPPASPDLAQPAGDLVAKLRLLSMGYQEQLRTRHRWCSSILPQGFTFLVGAGFLFAYVFAVIAPLYQAVAAW